jgi:hypothetical protein
MNKKKKRGTNKNGKKMDEMNKKKNEPLSIISGAEGVG